MKSNWNIKKFSYDIFIDIVGGVLIGLGIYNFAANAEFPLAGVSGLALILYRLFNIPIGWGTIALNIPIVIICFKTLGKEFFARSIRSLIISSLITDYVVTLLPVYSGDRMLAALCTGIFFWTWIRTDIYESFLNSGNGFRMCGNPFETPAYFIGENCILNRLCSCIIRRSNI